LEGDEDGGDVAAMGSKAATGNSGNRAFKGSMGQRAATNCSRICARQSPWDS
jgi:hypothetical protein